MLYRLIENYVKNMKEEDVVNYANESGIILNKQEANYVYKIIKKDYRTIIYGNPQNIFDDLKKNFNESTYNKIIQLYNEFKNKYIAYL